MSSTIKIIAFFGGNYRLNTEKIEKFIISLENFHFNENHENRNICCTIFLQSLTVSRSIRTPSSFIYFCLFCSKICNLRHRKDVSASLGNCELQMRIEMFHDHFQLFQQFVVVFIASLTCFVFVPIFYLISYLIMTLCYVCTSFWYFETSSYNIT